MKLLDLQTGKYLELGKDWVYFGEHIGILKADVLCGVQVEYVFSKIPHTNPIINQIAEKVGAVIYGGRYVLMLILDNAGNEICVGNIHKDVYKSNITYFILCYGFCNPKYDTNNRLEKPIDFAQQFYKITNFASYGWYFHKIWNNEYHETYAHYIGFLQKHFTDKRPNDNLYYGNIFEEFSKKEQRLENKFDELQSKIII